MSSLLVRRKGHDRVSRLLGMWCVEHDVRTKTCRQV
jgi:hypothetical protein